MLSGSQPHCCSKPPQNTPDEQLICCEISKCFFPYFLVSGYSQDGEANVDRRVF